MTTKTMNRKKRTHQTLMQSGGIFCSMFMHARTGVIKINKSKEPLVCWNHNGVLNYLYVTEFSGPNSFRRGSPLVLTARMNTYVTKSLLYHQSNSNLLEHKLGLTNDCDIATTPMIELMVKPDELEKLGRWMSDWLNAVQSNTINVPTSPIDLFCIGADEDLQDAYTKLDNTLELNTWQNLTSLWSMSAYSEFNNWYRNNN